MQKALQFELASLYCQSLFRKVTDSDLQVQRLANMGHANFTVLDMYYVRTTLSTKFAL